MIGKLKGTVDSIGDDWVIIDVGGVGYEVFCAARTLGALPHPGEAVTLSIETHVRETEIKLFGFLSEAEREWFRLLQSVQGVGAKVALAILGVLAPADLGNALALQDKAIITQAPGVGPKVAQRILNELKDKVPTLVTETAEGMPSPAAPAKPPSSAMSEAISALTNLGYTPQQAANAITAVLNRQGDDIAVGELIRLGLKELAQ